AFANQPFVRVLHTFEQHSPEAYTLVRQIGIDVPIELGASATYSVGMEQGAPLAGPLSGTVSATAKEPLLPTVSVFQEHNQTVGAGGTGGAGHGGGGAAVQDGRRGVAVSARYFWEQYPQSFELSVAGMTYNLWAPQAPPAKIGMGAAKTHEMVFNFSAAVVPSPALLSALAAPMRAHTDTHWVVHTTALRIT